MKYYRPGQDRDEDRGQVTHLYQVNPDNIMDFLLPMCSRGWNRDGGESFSIWRGQVGKAGICKICQRRADKQLDGVPSK